MKNTNFFEQVKCIIKSDCDSDMDNKVEIQQEETETPTENLTEGFHPFDIDEIFAN